jgi:hypothetical protein
MFGYIRPEKHSLLVCELARFRSIYCGLCKQIKRKYGNLPRLTLTYDLAFLATLLIALSDEGGDENNEVCILNPFRKKTILVHHLALEQCAGLSVLLFSAKMEDDFRDQRNRIKKLCRMGIAFPATMKIRSLKKSMPRETSIVKMGLAKLTILERDIECDEKTGEVASDLFGEILKQIFEQYASGYFETDPNRELLTEGFSTMGFFIGKWIYLIDAIEDYSSDIRNNRFNPFSAMKYEAAKITANESLELCEERIDCIAALLPYRRDSGIIRNIVQRGMPAVREAVLRREKPERI